MISPNARLESGHHLEDDVLVVVLLEPCEIKVRRESPLTADEHLPQASPSLEGQSREEAPIGK